MNGNLMIAPLSAKLEALDMVQEFAGGSLKSAIAAISFMQQSAKEGELGISADDAFESALEVLGECVKTLDEEVAGLRAKMKQAAV